MLRGGRLLLMTLGRKKVCGKCLIQREDTVPAQLLPGWLAQHWGWREDVKRRKAQCAGGTALAYVSS